MVSDPAADDIDPWFIVMVVGCGIAFAMTIGSISAGWLI